MRPLLLDLFCGAGGAAVGYHRAGFDVIGVDIKRQPRYPFPMVQADALDFLTWARLGSVAAIHASPPCRDHTRLTQMHGKVGNGWLLGSTRAALEQLGKPWVIENVVGATMRADYKLCGCIFGLPQLRRERWFETSPQLFDLRPPCHHQGYAVTVAGHPGGSSTRDGISIALTADWRRAMGIDWMTASEMAQAIPPAYTEYVGTQILAIL